MTKLSFTSLAAFSVLLCAPLASAEPVETQSTVEEMTVIGPKAHIWAPRPLLEQQYFESLQLQFGPKPDRFAAQTRRLAGEDPLDPRTWTAPPRVWDYPGSHVEEVAMMQLTAGRSSGW